MNATRGGTGDTREPRSGGTTTSPFPEITWPPRRICIVFLSALGDVVHALPVATALKRQWPGTHITWVTQPLPGRLLEGHPAVDAIVPFERRRGLAAWRSYAAARRQLRHQEFDLVLSMQTAIKTAPLLQMIRAPVKLGYDRRRARDLNWIFTTHRIPARPVRHVQDQLFEFLEHLGVDPHPIDWGLRITEEERRRQREFFAALKRPVVAIVMGTSKPEKNWMAERYARAIDSIQRDLGVTAVLVGGPSAIEKRIRDETLYRCSTVPVDAMGSDLRRLVWILDGADVVVSPDTGPLHIARALDTPVVGLYGYTNPRRFGPYAKYQDLVVDGYRRSPDEEYGFSTEYRPEGMKRVQAHQVIENVRLALERHVQR